MASNDFVAALERINAGLSKGSIRPCLEIHLYGTQARGAFKQALAAAVQAIEVRFPGTLRYYRTNTMATAKTVVLDAATLVNNFAAADEKKPAKLSGIEFFGGEKPYAFDLPSVDWFSTRLTPGEGIPPTRSYLRVCLPAMGDTATPAALKTLARELLQDFPLLAGHCGWSYYTGGGFSDAEVVIDRELPTWLLRYPGVAVGAPLGQANLMLDGLLATSWLTFVSEAAAKARGQDLSDLAKAASDRGLGSEIVHPGILEIQAGPKPETGDVDLQEMLPAYGDAGAVLALLAMPDDRAKYQTISGMDFETRVTWYRRFFGTAWRDLDRNDPVAGASGRGA
jgi:hypothetical protein